MLQETKEEMNFDEMILEAAKSIAAATSALIKAASAAQRELISSGKVSRTPLTSSDDGQWSEGLISAARLVAAATHSLVESANALIQGLSSEEKLISSAKQVASSTAQLLVACKVKADPDSESTKRLQAAGNAVKRATDNLVRAAQQAIQHEEERSLVLNRRIVGGIAQEINARSEVLRIEKELEEARGRLTAIRQAKYRNRSDTSDVETDNDQTNYDSLSRSDTRYNTTASPLNVQSSNSYSYDQSPNSTRNVNHVKNDGKYLISPEKVYSTQNTLELRRKEKENYGNDGIESTNVDSPYQQESLYGKSKDGFYEPVHQAPFEPKSLNRQFVKDAQKESTNYFNLKSLDQALDPRVTDAQNDQFTCKNNESYISQLQNYEHTPIYPESISNYRTTAETYQDPNRVSQMCTSTTTCETVDDVKEDNSYSNNENQMLQKISKQSTTRKVTQTNKVITESSSHQRIQNKQTFQF